MVASHDSTTYFSMNRQPELQWKTPPWQGERTGAYRSKAVPARQLVFILEQRSLRILRYNISATRTPQPAKYDSFNRPSPSEIQSDPMQESLPVQLPGSDRRGDSEIAGPCITSSGTASAIQSDDNRAPSSRKECPPSCTPLLPARQQSGRWPVSQGPRGKSCIPGDMNSVP
jgi:hypothetical protein